MCIKCISRYERNVSVDLMFVIVCLKKKLFINYNFLFYNPINVHEFSLVVSVFYYLFQKGVVFDSRARITEKSISKKFIIRKKPHLELVNTYKNSNSI